jgi:hypothetical protein
MPTREDTLIAKIKAQEPIAQIRKWFVDQLADGEDYVCVHDLTPFEQAFFNQMLFSFEAWVRELKGEQSIGLKLEREIEAPQH